MAVITISRQFGSHGDTVAQLANALSPILRVGNDPAQLTAIQNASIFWASGQLSLLRLLDDQTPSLPRPLKRAPGHRIWLTLIGACLSAALFVSGCAAPARQVGSSVLLPSTQPPSSKDTPGGEQITVYAPGTTSSVPIILALKEPETQTGTRQELDLTIFSNHSQANTLFLRGDIDILVTGLSVGIGFFKNGAPVQVVNCYVTGLTYLVTYGQPVTSFADLKGSELYVPFEGSPIEETSRFLAEREGLVWKRDIRPVYAASDSALALLKQGKARAAALPEPYASLAEQSSPGMGAEATQAGPHVSFGYSEKWNSLTGSKNGYPQVCTFVRKEWAGAHRQTLARLNDELTRAILGVQRDASAAAMKTGAELGLTQETLTAALGRTDFNLSDSDRMIQEIQLYYRTVGKTLDERYDSFFYR